MKIIYIAGPMRGIPYYNFPAFDQAKAELEQQGMEVISPADLDRATGFDPVSLPEDHDWSKFPDDSHFDRDACVKRDITSVMDADAICMLQGWRESVGATAEHSVAKFAGKRMFYAGDDDHPQEHDHPPQTDEIRVTDPDTGAEKGQKLARFDLIPASPLWDLAEHYGRGAQKYADRNYEKGYNWSLSYAAAQRHLNQFWAGEDIDAESGSKHVIAAAWHCFALALFMSTHPEKDDRPDTPKGYPNNHALL